MQPWSSKLAKSSEIEHRSGCIAFGRMSMIAC
jgi:hypothetical protein